MIRLIARTTSSAQDISAPLRVDDAPAAFLAGRMQQLGYTVVVAALVTIYATALTMARTLGIGVDYACFRAAARVLSQGHNPYSYSDLWTMENILYNAARHMPSGSGVSSYRPNLYYNPPLFAWALQPLAGLSFWLGYACYAIATILLAGVAAWLTLKAFGWTRYIPVAVGVALVSPYVFLGAWYGQQSALLLCAFAAALYALRRGHPGFAGACFVIAWIKPHLLIPVALALPFLLPPRAARRFYAGLCATTLCGLALMALTTGGASVVAWARALIGYTGYADTVQNYLPSLAGTAWLLLPHPWNRIAMGGLVIVGVAVMMFFIAFARRRDIDPCVGASVLMACWLLFTPFAHAHDDVLLLPALALACGRNAARVTRVLPSVALWSVSVLSFAFILPEPWKLLGVLPPVAVCCAAVAACVTIDNRKPLVDSATSYFRPPTIDFRLSTRGHAPAARRCRRG